MSASSGISKIDRFSPYFESKAVASEDKFKDFVNLLDQTPELTSDEKCQIFGRIRDSQAGHVDPSLLEKIETTAFSHGLAVDSQNRFIPGEAAELRKKDAACWRCVARQPSDDNGYLYTLQYRTAYTSPEVAIEPVIDPPRALGQATTEEERMRKSRFFNRFKSFNMKNLGYSLGTWKERASLTLPDHNTLQGRWQKLKSAITYLPNVYIISAEGVATHREFLMGFYRYLNSPCLILSAGKEFLHDHYAHIAVVLSNLLADEETSKKYQIQFAKDQLVVQKIHTQILAMREEIEKGNPPVSVQMQTSRGPIDVVYDREGLDACEAALSAACDVYTNQVYDEKFKSIEELLLGHVFSPEQRWVKHFGWDIIDVIEHFRRLARLIP